MACLLCFCFVASDEQIGIHDYSETSMMTTVDLITKHFSFSANILSLDVVKSPTTLCKTCWGNLEQFNEFHNFVASNYQIPEMKYQIPEIVPDSSDMIVFDDGDEKLETEMIKVEVVNENEQFAVSSEWLEDDEEDIMIPPVPASPPKKIKRIPSIHPPRTSRQSTVLDSADDQRIRETAQMNCDVCNEPLDSLRDAKAHFKLNHGLEGYLLCCDRKFRQRCRLVEHVNTHFNYSYVCPICSKSFDSKSYLSKHMACHDSNKQFECAHCPKSFSRKFQVRNHLLSVHVFDNVEPSFECPEESCGKKFVNQARLKHHLDYTHSTNHIEICEVCTKTFKTKNAIEEHMKTHSRKAEDRIRCEICGHFLADLKSYNRHVKNHGTEQLDNICTYCGKKSPNLNALKKHVKYVHEMTKSYQCRFCDKSFKRPRNLIDHEAALHTLQDLYSCTFCPRTFRNQSNMLAHRKKQHPDKYLKPSYMRDDL